MYSEFMGKLKMQKKLSLVILSLALIFTPYCSGKEVINEKLELRGVKSPPENFPDFMVPGHEEYMNSMEKLLYHHRTGVPGGTMWGLWMPMSQLWLESDRHDKLESDTRQDIEQRRFDKNGYISCHQHIGLAHPQGWPFPLWPMLKGAGWQFDVHDIIWGPALGVNQTTSLQGWFPEGFVSNGLIENKGILLNECCAGDTVYRSCRDC